MGILSFFNRSPNDGTFVSKQSFEKNLDSQVGMAPKTLNQIRNLTDSKDLRLEYFFYTNTRKKAEKLANELALLNYTSEYHTSEKNEFVITGWTNEIHMSEDSVIDWTQQMCRLGYRFDCEFDGWGTNPNQT